MNIPKKARAKAKALFRTCLMNGFLDESRVQKTVQNTIATKPRGYLAVLRHFQRLVKLDLARRMARIESAVVLPFELQSSLQTSLSRVYGPDLEVSFVRNPALIGGMRIRVGSDVYESTVQARLAALELSFGING